MNPAENVIDAWGGNLQAVLDELKVSQNQLAELLGQPGPNINRWCRGRARPSEEDQALIARTLVSLGWSGSVTSLFPRDDGELELVALAARYGEAHPEGHPGEQS